MAHECGEKNPKNVWWNDLVRATVERKEVLEANDKVAKDRYMKVYKEKAAWKVVLGARDKEAKQRCMEADREENRKGKRFIYQGKEEVYEQFRKMMTQDVNGNKKLF